MNFSSLSFLLVFLPLTVGGYALCRQRGLAKAWLLAASLLFYASIDLKHLPLLAGAMAATYGISRYLLKAQGRVRALWLFAGIGLNVGILLICKYVPGAVRPFPIGVSFYTIQQIAFLVDVYQGLIASVSLVDMALFVAWFPRVVSGPILDYRETCKEFQASDATPLQMKNMAAGLMLLFMGLGKKVLIADVLGPWVDEGFSSAPSLGLLEAWVTAFAYTFQIYFDFSGYSDMAVGIALLFNMRLPNNFDSPFRATSIIEFWSRWHISLTRFITSYLYTPLVRMAPRITFSWTIVATLITMTLVGLWHGPAWTFVLFGAIHGVAMGVNHIVRRLRWSIPNPLAWAMTFLVVTVAFVFFRAGSVTEALHMLDGMRGAHGLLLSERFYRYVMQVAPHIPVKAGTWHITHLGYEVIWIPILFVLTLQPHNSLKEQEVFRPSWGRAVLLTVLIFLCFLHLNQYVQFVYVRY